MENISVFFYLLPPPWEPLPRLAASALVPAELAERVPTEPAALAPMELPGRVPIELPERVPMSVPRECVPMFVLRECVPIELPVLIPSCVLL